MQYMRRYLPREHDSDRDRGFAYLLHMYANRRPTHAARVARDSALRMFCFLTGENDESVYEELQQALIASEEERIDA